MVSLPTKRILCVDDSADDCELFSFILTQEGHEVASAKSLRDALQLIENRSFDLGLFDIYLRDGTGFELLEKIRVIAPSIPLVFFSADARDSTRQKVMEAGAQAFFIKPFDLDLLITTIAQLMKCTCVY